MKGKYYIYLVIIGISAPAQRKGLGSKLMDDIKEECIRDGLHLYLETEKKKTWHFTKNTA
jgi:GNAT superfamily N-acetyltransferase